MLAYAALGAIGGSSVLTAATIANAAYDEMREHGPASSHTKVSHFHVAAVQCVIDHAQAVDGQN